MVRWDEYPERQPAKVVSLHESSKSELVALDRAAPAEGEANALREQLTQLTAALRDSRAGEGGRRE